MTVRAQATQTAVVIILVGYAVTENRIVNSFDLETMVFLGMTYGAWFKIIGFISVVLIIVVNVQTLWRNWRDDSRKSSKKKRK